MANNFYPAILLTGGASGALDAIDGAGLTDLDAAIVQTDGAVYFYHLDATSGAAEDSPNIIAPDDNPGTKRWVLQQFGIGNPYIRLHDSKSAGTESGTFTQGAWQKRTVIEDQDTDNNVSVASSVITLEAGTYDCLIRCPAYTVTRHQGRLRNTADNTTAVVGSGAYAHSDSNVNTDTVIQGRFTITAQKTFEIQHRCETTVANKGFGVEANFDEVEIFTVAEFWKIP